MDNHDFKDFLKKLDKLISTQDRQNELIEAQNKKLDRLIGEFSFNANKSAPYRQEQVMGAPGMDMPQKGDLSAMINAKRQEILNRINKDMPMPVGAPALRDG